MTNQTLISTQRPHAQILPHWGFGFNILICGGKQAFIPKHYTPALIPQIMSFSYVKYIHSIPQPPKFPLFPESMLKSKT